MTEAFDPTPPPPAPPDAPRRWWGRHGAELRWQAELGRLMIDPCSPAAACRAATAAR